MNKNCFGGGPIPILVAFYDMHRYSGLILVFPLPTGGFSNVFLVLRNKLEVNKGKGYLKC